MRPVESWEIDSHLLEAGGRRIQGLAGFHQCLILEEEIPENGGNTAEVRAIPL